MINVGSHEGGGEREKYRQKRSIMAIVKETPSEKTSILGEIAFERR